MSTYIALIDRAAGGSHGIVFPDFPGCVSAGDSFEEAVRAGAEALAFHVEGMRDDGEPIPAPRSLEAITATAGDWYDTVGSVVAVVPLLPPMARTARINVTMDERLIAEIDAVTTNRSAFLATAARKALGTP